MLEQLKYINHVNEVFEFGKDGIFVDMNELHDYEWSVTSKGNRISNLSRSVSTRKLPVKIICSTAEEGIAARNRLLEVCEKDVLAMQHGQIIIGDYYFKCFVTKSTKANYLVNKRYIEITLTLTTDYPFWVKESNQPFRPSGVDGDGLDYPFDYEFDYFTVLASTTIFNSSFVETNFRLIIYGYAVDPMITIDNHIYQVRGTVEAGQYLVVDSTTKKIYLVQQNGTQINKFNDRNKESYIFEKIPSGESPVSWDGTFGFDIVLMEERSEPKWT